MITPFQVKFPQEDLDDLCARVRNTRWPRSMPGIGWSQGTNFDYLKELCTYWSNGFDWRAVEAEINQYPNFIADVGGYKIHFMHVKGKGSKAIPLLMTHGWPGSFLEMMKVIPLLTEDQETCFDLVIPSLMGFGFSQQVTEPGCNSRFIAGLWVDLMKQLGYEKFGLQGGDIGAGVSSFIALDHPENVIGLHLNFVPGSFSPYIAEDAPLTEEELTAKERVAAWVQAEGAYLHLQSTKPLTPAYAMNDSPVGLCAWILEKFYSWSDNGGNIENCFTRDELLANITLYWLTQTAYSSFRIYMENAKSRLQLSKGQWVNVPVAIAHFAKEIGFPPQSYVKRGFNVQRWTDFETGGHFAAMEQPEALAGDLKAFFGDLIG